MTRSTLDRTLTVPRVGIASVALCAGLAIARAEQVFYVAADGNDAWSGTLADAPAGATDGPFATVARAQQTVRGVLAKAGEKPSVRVLIRGGRYFLDAPVVFGPTDSGTADAPVVYAAYPGEKPILSGGKQIAGWQEAKDGSWVVDVPGAKDGGWPFTQVFIDDQRKTRARAPNTGYFRTAGPIEPLGDRQKARGDRTTKMGFRLREGDLDAFADWQNMNVVVLHSWTASIHHVAELDRKQRVLRFDAPSGWPIGYWEKEQRYYVENARTALDAPGEWLLDQKAGVLRYLPQPNESPGGADVVAPVLPQLVLFRGEPELGLCVEHIHLKGLSLQHAAWRLPPGKAHDGQAAVSAGAAVHLTGVRHCRFENVEIAHAGTYGMWLGKGCQDNEVVRCEIRDTGAGGIMIGETSSPAQVCDSAARNVVDNCFIHDGGHIQHAGVGVWIGRSSYNRVSHNEICDFDYSGMSVGWCWGFAPSSANHNIVEYNHIHHLGFGTLSDMGGIYTLGVSPGTVLRGNLMHDISAYAYGGWGLYTDEGSSEILMEKNIAYNTKSGGFHQHYGRDNILRHNILAFSQEGQVIRSREEPHTSFTFEKNIVVTDNGIPVAKRWENGNFKIDSNLYWDTTAQEPLFDGYTLPEWQDEGHDTQSRIADPAFVDLAKRDFRLRPDSPAHAMGIESLDPARAGLYGDPEWVRKPLGVTRRVVDATMKTPEPQAKRRRMEIVDAFENTAVGKPASVARTIGEGQGASVRVTDETACGDGKRSLKFTDVPGLDQRWKPYIQYSVHWFRGTVRASFDVYLQPGTQFWHEWRDNANPYRVGPSLRFLPTGELKSGDRVLGEFPFDHWIHVEILCGLDANAADGFDLKLTSDGETSLHCVGVACGSPAWRSLDWIGFVSEGTASTVFYLDNVEFRRSADSPHH